MLKERDDMNITFLAGYFVPEKSADTHLNDDLARDFASYGCNVHVIVPFPNRGLSEEDVGKYETLRTEKINDRLTICRVGGKTRFKKGLIARGLSFLKKTFLLYREGKKNKTDCYFIVSTPPFLGYLAILLSRKTPVVYKLQDIFPDNLIEIKNLSESNLLVKILRRLEKKVYSSVSRILVCSNDVKETLIKRGVDEGKIAVVHDWVDETTCVPIPRNENPLFDTFGVSRDAFIFAYAGNIGHMQNIDTIVDAAKILQEKEPNIKVALIGDGVRKQHIEDRIQNESISNVIILPMQPLDKMSQVYSFGDVGLVSLKPSIAKTALPSKTWSIMSAARPVLCEIDLNCELADLICSESLGECVLPGDSCGMAAAMLKMHKMSSQELDAMGQQCREYIVSEMNRKKSTTKCYEQIIKTERREKNV